MEGRQGAFRQSNEEIHEEFEEVDAFLFFTVARYAALVFFASDADGRIGVDVGPGDAEDIGSSFIDEEK